MTTDLDLPDAVRASRRTFLKAAGAAAAVGLTIGFEWLDARRPAPPPPPPPPAPPP
ncbi:twin-arginine translocation signal domain-containing protein, partial [Burkholderia pseudomallei]|uniref:twin-arginine translocation signal domain-containing protein n=1 Tax=Burkholderia pseudomallei TaxID=28450 RepID=UPI001177AEF6